MKLNFFTAMQYFQKISPKNLLVFWGLPLLLILGSSIIVNFTPLARPAVAQVGPIPTNIPRYTVSAEFGRVRNGGEYYKAFSQDEPAASVCQQSCIDDDNCAAYTYNRPDRPDVENQQASCYLYKSAPASSPNTCCVSGVKF